MKPFPLLIAVLLLNSVIFAGTPKGFRKTDLKKAGITLDIPEVFVLKSDSLYLTGKDYTCEYLFKSTIDSTSTVYATFDPKVDTVETTLQKKQDFLNTYFANVKIVKLKGSEIKNLNGQKWLVVTLVKIKDNEERDLETSASAIIGTKSYSVAVKLKGKVTPENYALTETIINSVTINK